MEGRQVAPPGQVGWEAALLGLTHQEAYWPASSAACRLRGEAVCRSWAAALRPLPFAALPLKELASATQPQLGLGAEAAASRQVPVCHPSSQTLTADCASAAEGDEPGCQ